jgi:hypothetical protein
LHPRGYTLVAVATAELRQAQAIGLNQPNTRFGYPV